MYGHKGGPPAGVIGGGSLALTGVNIVVPIAIAAVCFIIGALLMVRGRMINSSR